MSHLTSIVNCESGGGWISFCLSRLLGIKSPSSFVLKLTSVVNRPCGRGWVSFSLLIQFHATMGTWKLWISSLGSIIGRWLDWLFSRNGAFWIDKSFRLFTWGFCFLGGINFHGGLLSFLFRCSCPLALDNGFEFPNQSRGVSILNKLIDGILKSGRTDLTSNRKSLNFLVQVWVIPMLGQILHGLFDQIANPIGILVCSTIRATGFPTGAARGFLVFITAGATLRTTWTGSTSTL